MLLKSVCYALRKDITLLSYMQTTTRANKLAASTKRGSQAKRLAITALHHGFFTIEGARETERREVKTGAKRFDNSEATQLHALFPSYIPQSR